MKPIRYIFILAFPLLLGGCASIGNFFDRVGDHMPTIGERCEHWQCFTEGGRQQSEMKKARKAMQREAEAKAEAQEKSQTRTPAAPEPSSAYPGQPQR